MKDAELKIKTGIVVAGKTDVMCCFGVAPLRGRGWHTDSRVRWLGVFA